MKRRKPILELQNHRDPPSHASRNTNEIQSLVCYSEDSDSEINNTSSKTISPLHKLEQSHADKPTTPWRACVDENTGYSYYWNIETNQVTWEVPPEYLAYESLLQQWETHHAKNTAKYEELSEIQQKSTEKGSSSMGQNSSSDSDTSVKDEKIELITAYGPSSDDSDSEKKNVRKINSKSNEIPSTKSNLIYNGKFAQPPNPSSPKPALVTKSVFSNENTVDGNLSDSRLNHKSDQESLSQNSNELLKTMTETKDSTRSSSNSASPLRTTKENLPNNSDKVSKSSAVVNRSNSDNSSDSNEDEDDEELDDVIISRLRKKATLLKQLGGEVPKEILSVFDNSKTAEDIIAEIEKEIPPDQTDNAIFKQPKPPEIRNKEQKSSETPPVKPLFPILDYMKKEESQAEVKTPPKGFVNQKNKMKNIQKIKLSARAKELIRTSLLTAKARATNFVETEDGLKPAEEVQKLEANENSTENTDANKSKLDPDEAAELEDFTPLPKKPSDAPSVIEDLEQKKSAPSANYFNLPDIPKVKEEKKGFSTTIEESTIVKRTDINVVQSESSNDGKYDFQQSFMVYYPKDKKSDSSAKKSDDAINASLWSKCEEFLKTGINCSDDIIPSSKEYSEELSKKNNEKSKGKGKNAKENLNAFCDIDIDEVLNTKNDNEDKKMTDLSQLIMEKLKFLSEGKGQVAPVQVMAIQIETLVGAWQTGALDLKYLSEWLDASLVQLKSIEESAAPSGWHCEWDRSYARYYYRNKVTGSIQWDFPEHDDSKRSTSRSSKQNSSRKSSRSRPRTPPPPMISDMVPPPPPVISDRDRDRKRRSSPRRDSDKRRRNEDRYSSRSSRSKHRRSRSRSRSRSPPSSAPVLPPLPPTPPKAASPPPPPPPSSPPPPPPPPPSISSSEFGPKFSENNYSDSCTTVTPMEIENDDEKPVKLHDELDSFYSDIASIEATFTQTSQTEQPVVKVEEAPIPAPLPAPKPAAIIDTSASQDKPAKSEDKVVKKKKKVKLDSGLSLKKKGLEGLVAKWQKVNSDI